MPLRTGSAKIIISNWNPVEEIPKAIENFERLKKQGPPHTRDKEKIKEHARQMQKVIDDLKAALRFYAPE